MTTSPPSKRVKLEPWSPPTTPKLDPNEEIEDENHCSICLQVIDDQTVIPNCSHEFCFECLLIWTKQSRRCPLCAQAIGDYLIHNIRSKYDFSKHYLTPIRSSPIPQAPLIYAANSALTTRVERRRRTAREREREVREREELDEVDKLERSIAKRRWIYQHHLYAKHVASNAFTRYKPYPSPAQFSASQDLISRTTSFVRRELQVWPNLDVEFLTTFTISIMKSIDIRSESAVKLLAEFLDMDVPYIEGRRLVNAEHFAHEIYSFVRSPYRDLFVYDDAVQYDIPSDVPPPPDFRERRRRWRRSPSQPRSLSPPPSSHSRSHSPISRSVSPREYRRSRAKDDSRKSSRSRSPSHSRTRFCEIDERQELPSSSRHETIQDSRSNRRQLVPESSMHCRRGTPSDDRDSSLRSVPGQTSGRSELVPSGTGQPPPGDALSNDALLTHEDKLFMNSDDALTHRKGKSKADDAKQSEDISSINIHCDSSAESHSLLTQSGTSTHKPPRNRTLRESVEAHLGSRKLIPIVGGDVNAKRMDSQSHAGNSVMSLPGNTSQLFTSSRKPRNGMSGTIAATELANSVHSSHLTCSPPSTQSSQQRSSTNNHPMDLNMPVNGECSGNSHVSPTSLSMFGPRVLGREILTASLATSSQDDAVKVRNAQAEADPREIPISNVNNTGPQFAKSDLRSRLLSRLKEERDHAYAVSAAQMGRVTEEERQASSCASNRYPADPSIAEEQSRKRAQLRTKLAAEKRVLLSGCDEGRI